MPVQLGQLYTLQKATYLDVNPPNMRPFDMPVLALAISRPRAAARDICPVEVDCRVLPRTMMTMGERKRFDLE